MIEKDHKILKHTLTSKSSLIKKHKLKAFHDSLIIDLYNYITLDVCNKIIIHKAITKFIVKAILYDIRSKEYCFHTGSCNLQKHY